MTQKELNALTAKLLPKILKAAQRLLKSKSPVQVEVSFIGPAKMKALNFEYRKKNYATDVLSFTAPEPFFSQGMLGELVICGSVLVSQAKEAGHSPATELLVLLVHGVTHLMGFDHEISKKSFQAQLKCEQKMFLLLKRKTRGLVDRSQAAE